MWCTIFGYDNYSIHSEPLVWNGCSLAITSTLVCCVQIIMICFVSKLLILFLNCYFLGNNLCSKHKIEYLVNQKNVNILMFMHAVYLCICSCFKVIYYLNIPHFPSLSAAPIEDTHIRTLFQASRWLVYGASPIFV